MRPAAIGLFLLLSSVAVAAQSTTQSSAPASQPATGGGDAVLTAPPANEPCPVYFSARRTPNSGLVVVKRPGNQPASPIEQGLELRLVSARKGWTIVKASVTLHGMSPAGGVVPVASSRPLVLQRGDAQRDLTETFELSATADAPLLYRTIRTKKLGAIARVEITRLEFANGQVWQASPQGGCTASPSPFVLVDATATR